MQIGSTNPGTAKTGGTAKKPQTVEEINAALIQLMGALATPTEDGESFILHQPLGWNGRWPARGNVYRSQDSAFRYGAPNFFQNREAVEELLRWIDTQAAETAAAFEQHFEEEARRSFTGKSWVAHCLGMSPTTITIAVCKAVGLA